MKSPLARQDRQRYVDTFVRPVFASFALQPPPPSKSWRLRGNGGSAYSFTVVWTPGRLSISGDIDNCTYEGCTYFRHWAEAAEFVADCDFEYLTGKSGAAKVFDRAKTLRDIVVMANEEARAFRKDEREERLRYRQEIEEERISGEFDAAARPCFLEDCPEYAPAVRLQKRVDLKTGFRFDTLLDFDGPDGWEMWHRIERTVAGYGDTLDSIFTPAGRRRLKSAIQERIETPERAADFCSEIGLDDYYGGYSLPSQATWHFEAIQTWAQLVCQTAEFETAIAERRVIIAAENREYRRRAAYARRERQYEQSQGAIADDDGMGLVWRSAA